MIKFFKWFFLALFVLSAVAIYYFYKYYSYKEVECCMVSMMLCWTAFSICNATISAKELRELNQLYVNVLSSKLDLHESHRRDVGVLKNRIEASDSKNRELDTLNSEHLVKVSNLKSELLTEQNKVLVFVKEIRELRERLLDHPPRPMPNIVPKKKSKSKKR